MHRILLEDGHKPSVEDQRRLNPTMKEVVRKEVLKWLDVSVIYPISDSSWVSLVQVVSRKGGTIVIKKRITLLPISNSYGVEICINYQKLNKVTRKYHFPLCFWIRCWIDWQGMSINVFWIGIRVTIISLYP